MTDVNTAFLEFFNREGISTQSKYLLACSGGIDSMVLATLFVRNDIPAVLVHCNFQLRGYDSDEDERLVKDFASENQLPFFSRRFSTRSYAEENRISIQMAARELRYNYFEEVRDTESCEFICTAHHADDSLETILLNLGRGTGISGLSGIHSRRGEILRPLLGLSKVELKAYAELQKIRWREDASNEKTDYQRNKLRHDIIPEFSKVFPGFNQSIKKTLHWLQEDNQLFNDMLKQRIRDLVKEEKGDLILSREELRKMPGAISFLYHWLSPYGAFDYAAIMAGLHSESGRIFEVGSYSLLSDRENLILRKTKNQDAEIYFIAEGQKHIANPINLEFETFEAEGYSIPKNKDVAALDLDRIQFPLQLRRWQSGDKFRPLGMKGFKKLSDFFIDSGFSRFDKEDCWLLCSGEDIVWIVNHRIDDRYKITNTTKTVYFARVI